MQRSNVASKWNISVRKSWGIASARHTSGIVPRVLDGKKRVFDAPLGPSIIRWDVEKQDRDLDFQVRGARTPVMLYSVSEYACVVHLTWKLSFRSVQRFAIRNM